MPGFMKDVGHAMAALLTQVETGQSVSLGQGGSLVAQNPIVHSCDNVPNLSSLGLCG